MDLAPVMSCTASVDRARWDRGERPKLTRPRSAPGWRQPMPARHSRRQQPPARRVRRPGPEHARLVGRHGDVADIAPAVGDHRRETHQRSAWIMHGLRRDPAGEHLPQPGGQRSPVSEIGQQPRARMRHDTLPVSGHIPCRASPGSVHAEGASRFGDQGRPQSLTEQALSFTYTPPKPYDLGEPRFRPKDRSAAGLP